MKLTRKQQEIYDILRTDTDLMEPPPTYDELCRRLGLRSRGSLYKHIHALIQAGLIEPMEGQQRGIRLVEKDEPQEGIPFLGRIAAGYPIEAVTQAETMDVPARMVDSKPCYVLQVTGESMIEEGILDGDYVVIEKADVAANGNIVVALINREETTLKRIEQMPGKTRLYPANSAMSVMEYHPEEIQIQGILRGLLRYYR
jgi:repressor LexA